MKRTMTILTMVSLAAVLAMGTFAQAGTYTLDSSASDWFTGANGFTATNQAADIYGKAR